MLFEKISYLVVKCSKTILIFFAILVAVAGYFGSSVFNKLDTGGFSDPTSESYKASEYLKTEFKQNDPQVILIVETPYSVTEPLVVEESRVLERDINGISGVDHAYSYWSTEGLVPFFVSKDKKASYLFVYVKEADKKNLDSIAKKIEDISNRKYKSIKVYVTGENIVNTEVNRTISKDLVLSESISIPLSFGLLLIVFGTVVSSLIPILMGVFAIFGALFLLWGIATFTTVSVFALHLVTGLGLGLGIDYSLLMVNRFREELTHTGHVPTAVVNTLNTAGKTVFYSGLTVMVTLAALLFFPIPFLKSFGYAGVSVVMFAIICAILPLPALLAMLGHNVNKGVIRKSAIVAKSEGVFSRMARSVMRYPVSISIFCFIILAVFTLPVRNISFAQSDAYILPETSQAVISHNIVQKYFPDQDNSPINIIIPNGKLNENAVDNYVKALSNVKGIVRVDPVQYEKNDARVSAIQSYGLRTPEAKKMIHEIRALPKPAGTLVGGETADVLDSEEGIKNALPKVLTWIALSVLILIFIFTGSIILPIKAVILNALSLTATMGVLTFIFIQGHLQWLVGKFTLTGTLDTGAGIMIAVVVFGLSMDYELFLLSRIKEDYLAGHTNHSAIAVGLQKSGNIITAAALIMAVVFISFVTSGVTPIKLMGFGIAFAVLLDATLIRIFLVPALMEIFGKLNWWAPKFLKRFTIKH